MDLNTLREKMQQDGWLGGDTADETPTVGDSDAVSLAMDQLHGNEPVMHPTEGADERMLRAGAEHDSQEVQFAQERADLSDTDRAQSIADLRNDNARFATADHSEAFTVAQWVSKAHDAGVSQAEMAGVFNHDDWAPRLQQLITEHGNADQGTTAVGDAGGASEAGQGAASTVAEPAESYGLFGEPTSAEQTAAASRAKDAERNGLTGGRSDTGDGGLFDGQRPEQTRVPEQAPVDSHEQRMHDMGTRTLTRELENAQHPYRGEPDPRRVQQAQAKLDAHLANTPHPLKVGEQTGYASRDMFGASKGEQHGKDQAGDGRQDDNSRSVTAGRDDKSGIRPRSDATPSLVRRGKYAVDALVRRFNGSVFADRISRDFQEHGTAKLIGQTIGSRQDAAVAASVYRNPIFETSRFIFMDGAGKVVHETAVTSREAGASAAFPQGKESSGWLHEQAEKFGATQVVMTHNHPSGDPSPSKADNTVTTEIARALAGSKLRFLGHVVTNHTRYGFITPGGEVSEGSIPVNGPDPLVDPRGTLTDAKMFSAGSVASYASKLYNLAPKDSIGVMVVDVKGNLTLASTIPAEVFTGKRGAALVDTIARRSRGDRVYVVGESATLANNLTAIRQAQKLGLTMDAFGSIQTGP